MVNFSDIELVIFDLDGTLIDSALDLAIALEKALAEEGIRNYTLEDLIQRIGVGSKNLLRELVNDDDIVEKRVFQYYTKHYAAGMLENTKLFPKVEDVLEKLKPRSVALLSNKREQPCRTLLKHFKIDHHFKATLGGDSLSKRKPDPEPILHICKTLGHDPRTAVMIGDSPVDIVAGRAAGTHTIGILKGLTPRDVMEKGNAHMLIEEVGHLLDFVTEKS